jgi:hypothetical protein
MKEPRPYLLTVVSIFLIVSVLLLATTAYLYVKKPSGLTVLSQNNSSNITANTRDSLQKIYSATVKDLTASFAAMPATYKDSLEKQDEEINSSLKKAGDSSRDFDKLRNEINTILSDKSSNADLELAKIKINELQLMLDALKNKNNQIIKENEKLYNMLKQYTEEREKTESESKNNETPQISKQKNNPAPILKADYILLSAVTSTDFIDKETNQAEATDKLVATVTLRNNSSENTISEVMVVIRQPDGTVLQNSNWETGIFYTKEGKQIYSKKLRFNNSNGEVKRLNFSLESEKYFPGKYTMEVYYDGSIIGRAVKILS